MKLIFGTMYFHRHGNGGGGPGKLYPMVNNEHRPPDRMDTLINNLYLKYPFMGFKKL